MSDSRKRWLDHDMYAASQGILYPVGAGRAGESLQRKSVTATGATYVFNFVAEGLVDMADALYDVIVQGPNGDERCDYATRATTGFTITGTANAEVLIVLVAGRLAGQVAHT